jgi:hypothetical protein
VLLFVIAHGFPYPAHHKHKRKKNAKHHQEDAVGHRESVFVRVISGEELFKVIVDCFVLRTYAVP